MKTKHRNPNDATFRNINALKKHQRELEKTILVMGKLLKDHDKQLDLLRSIVGGLVRRAKAER